MKKIYTIAAIFAIGFSANAQQEVKYGPKAGVNFATVSNVENSKMLTGFYVGAVAEIKFNDKFSVQPELVYSAQGVKQEYNETFAGMTINETFTSKFDYINIPIMAKYYVYEGLSVELGPQFGFLVKAETKGGGEKVDAKDSTKSFDFGVGAGLAYDLANGFFANARYNFGLTDVAKNNESNDTFKNGVIQVGVGYKF